MVTFPYLSSSTVLSLIVWLVNFCYCSIEDCWAPILIAVNLEKFEFFWVVSFVCFC